MAALARFLQRRLISTQSFYHDANPILHASSERSSISVILNRHGFHKRGILTQTMSTTEKSSVNPDNVPTSMSTTENSGINVSGNSSLKTSPRHDLAMVYTCKVCETRSIKTVCRESYEKGVVIVRCGGCNNLHLTADHRGWFGEPGTVEDFLAARGEEVKSGSVDTLSLTLEDIAGKQTSNVNSEIMEG